MKRRFWTGMSFMVAGFIVCSLAYRVGYRAEYPDMVPLAMSVTLDHPATP